MPIRVDLVRTFSNSTVEPTGPPVPSTPYVLGTEVGVPTGTVLTPTSGLPAADDTDTYLLVHPVTEDTEDRPVSVWENRSWSSTLTLTPGSGQTYLFRNCRFTNEADNWCVEVVDSNFTADQMIPLVIFDHCEFDGNDSCARALLAGCTWIVDCHLTGSEDAWSGAYWSVALRSNFVPTTDGGVDPHQDGIQNAGIGKLDIWQCWTTAGDDPVSNAAVRIGTDFSAIADVGIYYSALSGGGYALQVRGDPGDRGVTGFRAVGNRWGASGFGPTDFEVTTVAEWSDNAYFEGTPIPNPVP